MKIQNNLIWSIIITILWFSLIFWNRIIRERLPKVIVQEDILSRHVVTIAALCLFSITILSYYILKQIKVIPRKNSKWNLLKKRFSNYLSKQQWFSKYTSFLSEHLLNGPQNVYENFIYKRFYLKRKINFVGAKFAYYFQENPDIPYILLFVLPKTIPWIILFFELILWQYVEFFYKSLILLLIPLVSNILLYIIEHHSKNCINWYKPYFEFEYIDDTIHTYFKPLLDNTKENIDKQESLSQYAGEDWFFYQNLYSICYKIQEKKTLYHSPLSILIYGLMTIDFCIYLLLSLGF